MYRSKLMARTAWLAVLGTLIAAGTAAAVPDGDAPSVSALTSGGRSPITLGSPRILPSRTVQHPRTETPAANAAAVNPQSSVGLKIKTRTFHGGDDLLPLWTFDIKASRDDAHHQGTVVGRSPFTDSGTDRVPTYIVPLIIRTHRVATGIDPKTLVMTTAPQDTSSDPTAADGVCLKAPNNVPATLVRQSPVLTPTKFVMGGKDFGTTQYIDAFQRAEFFKALGRNVDNYHLLLSPVRTLEPIVVDVPPNEGVAIDDPNFFVHDFKFTFCAPFQLVDLNWFDTFVQGTIIPALAEQGVEGGALPILVTYGAAFPQADVVDLNNCCAVGYHNATGTPLVTHSYAVADFDRTGFFRGPANGLDTEVLSHEIGEWANDPLVSNPTPPWGGTGQVAACQANFEVGDPLTGTDVPPVTMPNGFTYHLQELAFFSWFYGQPSVGIDEVFSNNGTFLHDAGPLCP